LNRPELTHFPVSLNDLVVSGIVAPTVRLVVTAIDPPYIKVAGKPVAGHSARAAADHPKARIKSIRARTNTREMFPLPDVFIFSPSLKYQ
jgi:hypothetical protein